VGYPLAIREVQSLTDPARRPDPNLALLLADKRLRQIIPGFIQTRRYPGFAFIKFRSRYYQACPLIIDSAIRKLATLVTEPVHVGTDLRYLRPADEIRAVTGSKTAVRHAGISRCDSDWYDRVIGISAREICGAARDQQ